MTMTDAESDPLTLPRRSIVFRYRLSTLMLLCAGFCVGIVLTLDYWKVRQAKANYEWQVQAWQSDHVLLIELIDPLAEAYQAEKKSIFYSDRGALDRLHCRIAALRVQVDGAIDCAADDRRRMHMEGVETIFADAKVGDGLIHLTDSGVMIGTQAVE